MEGATNPFQPAAASDSPTSWKLTLHDMVGTSPEPAVAELVAEGVARLEAELAGDGVAIPMASEPDTTRTLLFPHGYLTYWALVALAAWGHHEGAFATPSLRWSETELYRQIALFQTGHDERSDAYQLGYNLLTQYRFNKLRLGNSIVELGLRTLFSAQLEDTVIFFDEMEALMHTRTDSAGTFEQKFLTTSLLP